MTLAEQLRKEGRAEGLQEGEEKGKLKVAKSLLMEGLEAIFVSKVTGLPLSLIETL